VKLSELVEECESHAEHWMQPHDLSVGVLAWELQAARRAARACSDIARAIEGQLAEKMEGKTEVVEGVGTLERHWSPAKTTWNHGPLATLVAAASRDERVLDEKTGVIEGEAEASARVLLRNAGISYWRVGELKRLGIDPDEYREKEGGRWTVRFV
jgi:hypothetical protein